MAIKWPRDYAIQVGLHLPITTAICGAILLHWSLAMPASVLLWYYHEVTQSRAAGEPNAGERAGERARRGGGDS